MFKYIYKYNFKSWMHLMYMILCSDSLATSINNKCIYIYHNNVDVKGLKTKQLKNSVVWLYIIQCYEKRRYAIF